MRVRRLVLGLVFLLAMSTAALTVGKLALFAFSAAKPGAQSTVTLEIRKGEGPHEIARALSEAKAITSIEDFVWVGRLTRQWKKLKAGEYEISSGMSPIEIFEILSSGISVIHPITLREGENMYEIAEDLETRLLAKEPYVLKLCRDPRFIQSLGFQAPLPPSLEGYLFPDTYYFNKTMTPEEMLRQMVRHFNQIWTREEDSRARALGMTRHQVVTLASIIEKETGAPEERPLISSVFHNRLRKKMRIQSDPTTIYGMWDRYEGNIHRSNLLEKNSYNTYTLPALPIGPISNPGHDAIHASLYPAETDYLFFVSHNNGTHEFTKNLQDHNRAVAKFQLDPKAHEGKSWRDLSKRNPGQTPAPAAAQGQ